MTALLSALIWIVFFPVWLVVVILYEAQAILLSRRLGVSRTALSPMTMRWLQHQLGLRRDEACAKLIKVLPNHSYIGLCAVAFPVWLGHRLTGFVPKMLRYPYEGIPSARHSSSVRATFVDAAIERYLPGVEQFVVLGAGYDTRTVQLHHNRRICCFEVDLPKTQQMKRELLHQCGVNTSGVKFVPANFLTDDWLDNLAKAGFDPRKSISETLAATINASGVEAAVRQYRELKLSAPTTYNFDEKELNDLGYQLIGAKKLQEAIRILQLNAEAYPQSSNVYDSLGEAYMDDGNKPLAILNYQKSLQMNPRNRGAVLALQKLGAP